MDRYRDTHIYIIGNPWRGNRIKEREVRFVIRQHVQDEAEAERIFELVKNQREY